jgi:hypothetical protein
MTDELTDRRSTDTRSISNTDTSNTANETTVTTMINRRTDTYNILIKNWVLPPATIHTLDKYYLLKWSRKFFLLSLIQDSTNDADETKPHKIAHQGIIYNVYYKGVTRYEDVILSDATTVMVSFRKCKVVGAPPIALVKLVTNNINVQ